jgi:hypothetical protein
MKLWVEAPLPEMAMYMLQKKNKKRYGRTEADDVVVLGTAVYDVPHPRVILDPPDKPLWAGLDLTNIILARGGATRELISRLLVQVQHDLNFARRAWRG